VECHSHAPAAPLSRASLRAMHAFLQAACAAGVAAALYASAVYGGFAFDDRFAVLSNPNVAAPEAHALRDVWTSDFWGRPMDSNSSHKS